MRIDRALLVLLIACGSPQAAAPPTTPEPTERHDQLVTEADLQILTRADAILASPAVWNRHDTRDCPVGEQTWSLFCALHDACVEVLGTYQHRAVALQEVRFAVEDATKGVELEHRMMDYNNMTSTRFEDIKRVIAIATGRVRTRLAAQQH